MSISSLGAGLSPLTQATPQSSAQAPSRQIQQERPHHGHGHGGGKAPATTESASATSTSTTGTTLNSLV